MDYCTVMEVISGRALLEFCYDRHCPDRNLGGGVPFDRTNCPYSEPSACNSRTDKLSLLRRRDKTTCLYWDVRDRTNCPPIILTIYYINLKTLYYFLPPSLRSVSNTRGYAFPTLGTHWMCSKGRELRCLWVCLVTGESLFRLTSCCWLW